MTDTIQPKESLYRTAWDAITLRWVRVQFIGFKADVLGYPVATYRIWAGTEFTAIRSQHELDRLCF